MSIRIKLLALMGVLGTLLIALSSWQAMDAWVQARTGARAAEVTQIVDELVTAASAWAVERGSLNGLLANPAAASDEQRRQVAAKRAEGNAAFERAAAQIGDPPAMAAVRDSLARVAELRKRADAALQDGKADPSLTAAWFPALSDLIMRSQDLASGLRNGIAGRVDTRVMESLDLKHALWETSEFAGRERGIMNGAIAAGKRLAPEQLLSLGAFRGRVESAWATVQAADDHLGAEPRHAIADANAQFFGQFEKTRTEVYRAGGEGAAYPIPAAEWFKRSTEAIGHLLNAQKVTTADLTAHVNGERTGAERRLALALAALVGSLAAVSVAVWVLLRQVSGPLAGMTAAMRRLADHDLTVEVPGAARRDEIGGMASAVRVFKDNLIETERLRADQAETERRATADKRQAMDDLASDFERRVGTVVQSVAAAASQMGGNAQRLNEVAGSTKEQAVIVATASVEMSSNVQTVASATEEMSASIGEISQQVASTQSITTEAVEQASRAAAIVSTLAEAADRDRSGRRADQRHRRADEPARAQRHHRGGPRRRGRQGLRGGRVRGEGARHADRQGDRGDRQPDRRRAAQHARCRLGDRDDHGDDRSDQALFGRRRLGGRGADRDDAGDRPQHRADRPCEPGGERPGRDRVGRRVGDRAGGAGDARRLRHAVVERRHAAQGGRVLHRPGAGGLIGDAVASGA